MKGIINSVEFKELLEMYRKRAKLNKTALAGRIGVAPPYYMQIESGVKRPPPLEKCEKIAKILNLNEEEKNDFIEAAIKERAKEETLNWLESKSSKTFEIPVISWVHANQFSPAEDPFPLGTSDEYVITTTRGDNMFALKIVSDCMSPEFVEGDIIVIKPNVHISNGDYVVVKNTDSNEATFKQYKRKGNKIILHPLNPKYPDIVLDENGSYEIIGKVVEKVKKY